MMEEVERGFKEKYEDGQLQQGISDLGIPAVCRT